ncbi:helix-turn-helix transcriptional regulator [Pseudomonas chlororaphis]|uniref:Peptidase S24-like protein n=1 Tax=Pseudomonas chlororaphis O6 TaxID=1037915 RepID=A0AB33WME1_9PSED|nr:S24 family peptidase [Pseudomonas chlororaphis]EIM14230.1 peptidase S24-like protein [Pseudomonas chlororaphis O6]
MKTTERITKLVMARKPTISVRNVKRDIATTCGISYEAVRQWFAGDTENIKNENLVAISEGYDTTVDWLLSGKGEPPRRKGVTTTAEDPVGSSSAADLVQKMLEKHGKGLPEEARQKIVDAVADGAASGQAGNVISADFSGRRLQPGDISIPQYDIRGAMGHGQVPADYSEAIRNVVISEDVLRDKGIQYSTAASLAMITGWGQSMEGTINDKDPVIVDRGINEFAGDGVYVITWHDLLYIKRLQVHDADHFEMISDNPKHKDRVVPIGDVIIHAKVLLVWNARKL